MAQWTTYSLQPKPGAGFHFGLRGLDQEESAPHCPSDTLFAALIATLADLEGTQGVEDFTAPFEAGRPPFLLTSVFPYAGDLPLLPLPFVRLNLTPQPGQRKLLKRLRYVSPALFRHMLQRADLDAYAEEEGSFLQNGRVWITAGERASLPRAWRDLSSSELRQKKVWGAESVDRVTVDRLTSASNVFRIGRTVYAPGCGLWFAARWPAAPDPAVQGQLERLLLHLGDRGLGGERSIGYGQFTPENEPYTLDLPDVGADGLALTLARYLPRRQELPDALRGGAAFRLAAIPGWLNAPGHRAQRRRQVRMVREGGVFRPVGPGPWGRLEDVRPAGWEAYPIWRYGYACPVGLASREVQDA